MINREYLAIRIDAIQRLFMWHILSRKIPLYLVTEYPKSGGSWFAQILSDYLKLPFIRNERPSLTSLKPCVLHGHHPYNSNFKNVFCVIRDGRDVMVSAYYYMLIYNEKNPSWMVDKIRAKLQFRDYADITINLPNFIEFMFTAYTKGYFRTRWDRFVLSWYERGQNLIKYEDLLNNPVVTVAEGLEKVLHKKVDWDHLTSVVEHYSFKNLTGRERGHENINSFLRKGIAGDWKSKFTKEASKVFDYYAGDTLIKLGYERSRDWVNNADSYIT